MKTLEEFNAFVEIKLNSDLEQLERQRQAGKNWMRWLWAGSILFVVVFAVGMFRYSMQAAQQSSEAAAGSGNQIFLILGIVLLFTAGSYGLRYFMMRQKGAGEATDYKQDFKNKVVRPIIAFINPEYTYQPINHASYEEFTESGLFSKKSYVINGNDQVYGKMGEMNFQFCDLTVTHMPVLTLRGQGPDIVFSGSYFIGQFPRYFSTPVYIISRNTTTENLFSSTHSDSGFIETWNLGKKVLPADSNFNKSFMVYSQDTTEAQQLLTPALMEKIQALQERSQAKLFISFYNNRIYVGISHGLDYFEISLNKSLSDRQMLKDYYLDFMSLLQLAEDLKQNVSIWTTTAFSRS
ncbi:uncharacterized protein DUF3137 [Chitinophaga niastensis]|uniref:Uncharacterized protein DUF3137 n=1 Tax=Chitinophaga niastensis TaxID=536980 RepID=A0A2P8HK99_CHINA|nr:DUF3137 domain-containing protein [Chitinophaga niastensis]PSL46645.1 uncharacterized protein DUF3137 [Chitinophaga niastensis]